MEIQDILVGQRWRSWCSCLRATKYIGERRRWPSGEIVEINRGLFGLTGRFLGVPPRHSWSKVRSLVIVNGVLPRNLRICNYQPACQRTYKARMCRHIWRSRRWQFAWHDRLGFEENLFIHDPLNVDQSAVYYIYRGEIVDLERGVKCGKLHTHSTAVVLCFIVV